MSDKTPTAIPVPNQETLIAFAAKLIPHKTCIFGNRDSYVGYGPSDNSSFLDAIATICVSQEASQSVAAAIAINYCAREVQLTVIQHGDASVPDEQLKEYLIMTWRLIQHLAAHHRRRALGPGPTAREMLVLHLYKYTWKHLAQQFKDWWPMVDATHRRLVRSWRHKSIDETQIIFKRAVLMLRFVQPIVTDDMEMMSDTMWSSMLSMMEVAARDVRELNRRWACCRKWGDDFNEKYFTDRPSICDALMNLTSLQRHIFFLTSFGYYPRPACALAYHLKIIFPHPTPIPVLLPTSITSWVDTISYVSGTERFFDSAWPLKQATQLSETYPPPHSCIPHPECALIAHLEKNRTAYPPLGYIGVSAPSCAACTHWLTAYHARGRRRFKHRGTNRTWEWPWVPPQGVKVDISGLPKSARDSCNYAMEESGVFNHWWPSYMDGSNFSPDLQGNPNWIDTDREEGCVFGCWGECKCIHGLFDGCYAVVKGEQEEEEEDLPCFWYLDDSE